MGLGPLSQAGGPVSGCGAGGYQHMGTGVYGGPGHLWGSWGFGGAALSHHLCAEEEPGGVERGGQRCGDPGQPTLQ